MLIRELHTQSSSVRDQLTAEHKLERDLPSNSPLEKMSDSETILIVGGWSSGTVTPEARAALERALIGSDLTVTTILSVRSQVVAGTNYEFEVEGSSTSQNHVNRFLVKVFDQPWTNTTQLTSVVAAPAP
ncbi:unnamed protein product [Phytophthora fragariaefolia]|uniref:Unnamed protein product n=1 Tax=Phytophthora fragariaefolia TaxID=1490495 RepID=A0A9W6XQ55_9STRA|nr:unnamed protein product [Phytophthora fragariaefolia]